MESLVLPKSIKHLSRCIVKPCMNRIVKLVGRRIVNVNLLSYHSVNYSHHSLFWIIKSAWNDAFVQQTRIVENFPRRNLMKEAQANVLFCKMHLMNFFVKTLNGNMFHHCCLATISFEGSFFELLLLLPRFFSHWNRLGLGSKRGLPMDSKGWGFLYKNMWQLLASSRIDKLSKLCFSTDYLNLP